MGAAKAVILQRLHLLEVIASVGAHITPPGLREVHMDTNQSTGKLTDYAMKNVHHKARKLIGQLGFTESDQPDIEHDLIVDLLARLPKFDPSKAAYVVRSARNTWCVCAASFGKRRWWTI